MRHPVLIAIAAAGLVALGICIAAYQGALSRWMPASSAAVAAPGPVDIGFAQFMSLHHQQAIGMAQLMLDGRPSPLATLARSIAYTQLLELGEMRGWLRLWNQALVPEKRSMDWMLQGSTAPDEALLQYLLDCQRSPTGMSGLATDAEVDGLRQLDGRARDEHFLRLMLAHHQGGLPMARYAATEARVAAVRELASRVVVEQSQEIHRILLTLQALTAAPG